MKRNLIPILMVLLALAAVAAVGSIDTYSGSTPVSSIYADTTRVDVTGVGVDLYGYYGCTVVGIVGEGATNLVLSADSTIIEWELEESSDNSSFTDVADAHLLGYEAGTNDGCFGVVVADSTVSHASYIGTKRYVRILANFTGDAADDEIPISAIVIRSGPKYGPVN